MTGQTFITKPAYYERNYGMGAILRLVPAEIGTNTGSIPGVAIFKGPSYLLAVITVEHAWRLSDQLTDVLDSLPDGGAA